MTDTKSLSERLRMEGRGTDWSDWAREAADALDAKNAEIDVKDFLIAERNAEIELLKEGRKLHDELADHLEHEIAAQSELLAQADRALELSASALSRTSGAMETEDPFVTEVHQIVCVALAAIRKEKS